MDRTAGMAWSVAPDGSPGPAWRACLEAAIAAPSLHNSQPWRFRLDAAGVDVFVDRRRQLGVIDPRGREMLISVGAAIFNLRVAILAHGRQPVTMPLPDPAEPDLAARIMPARSVQPDETVSALADAIPTRRTNRQPFADVAPPDEVFADLAAAARTEGAGLLVADRNGRNAVLDLIRWADNQLRDRETYRAELSQWTHDQAGGRDGIPAEAFGPWGALETLPLRDFGLLLPGGARQEARFEAEPNIAVLYTFGDTPLHWLRAGQALERVLLTATVRGVSTTLMTQPMELAELRALLADPRNRRAWAQAVLRLGYGPPTPSTPRRPLDDVLLPPAHRV